MFLQNISLLLNPSGYILIFTTIFSSTLIFLSKVVFYITQFMLSYVNDIMSLKLIIYTSVMKYILSDHLTKQYTNH